MPGSSIEPGMTNDDIQDFITRFAAAWAARDGDAFLTLWHPDGVLHSPLYDRPVAGNELGRLTELVKQRAPDSVWQLLDWTSRGDIIVIEWQTTRMAGGKRFDWRGVDKFRLRDGRIIEERVYMDTAPLCAAAEGLALTPVIPL
jgi:ketosteroid isomerase-like protein